MGLIAIMVLVLALQAHEAAAASDCKKDALASHNFFRAIHQAPALVWNDTLASEAQDRVNSLTSNNECALTLNTEGKLETAVRIDPSKNWTSPCSLVTLASYAAGVNWSFSGSKTPVKDNQALISGARYVLDLAVVIWAGINQVGCAAAQASTGCWSVVCRYFPHDPLLGVVPDTSDATEAAYVKNMKPPVAPFNLSADDSCNAVILSNHNHHRAEYQSPPMSWDTMRAAGAQAWAEQLAQHNCSKDNSNLVAEVAYTWSNGTDSTICAQLSEIIYRQVYTYNFTSTPKSDNTQLPAFVAMVARNMTKIGCGVAKGTTGCVSTVCWYGPEASWDDRSLFQDVRLPAPSPGIDGGQCQQAALARINQYRAAHSTPSLAWNSSLAAVAQGLATSAAGDKCDLSWLQEKNGVLGFTVKAATSTDVCSQAVDSFYSAGNATFNFTRTPWTDNQDTYNQWYTYTQVIWKDTTQVGCGGFLGPDGCWVVICKYDPPGNMQTDTAFILNVAPLRALNAPPPAPPIAAPPPPQPPSSSSSNSSSSSDSGNNTSKKDSGSGHSSSTIAIVIGVCVGVGVLIAVGAGYLIWQRRQRNKQNTANHNIWSKTSKPPAVTSESNTATGFTGSSGQLDTTNMQQQASPALAPASTAAHSMAIPGLMTGEPFTRGTAFEYTWNSSYRFSHGRTQAVEAGLNDMQLDGLVQGSGGQLQDCPVVYLSKEQVKEQLQLLTHGLRGRGGAALVFKALWPSRFGPDALLAVKVMKDGYDCSQYVLQSFAHEASVLASVRHPNVVKLYGYCLDPPNVCLIMELLPCSLKEVLYGTHHTAANTSGMDIAPNCRTMSQVLQVSTEIAAGLAYLHDQPQQGLKDVDGRAMPVLAEESEAAADVEQAAASQKIVHRDLKPANILINSLGQVKISDFGLARRHDSTTIETKNMGAGTVPYQAPEILTHSRAGALGMKPTNRCDVYSMAMIFWELLSRQPPWKDMDEVNIITQVISSKRPELPAPETTPSTEDSSLDLTQLPASLTALPAYNDIIRQCWAQRDWRRPTAAEAHRLLVELQQKYHASQAGTVQVTIAGSVVK